MDPRDKTAKRERIYDILDGTYPPASSPAIDRTPLQTLALQTPPSFLPINSRMLIIPFVLGIAALFFAFGPTDAYESFDERWVLILIMFTLCVWLWYFERERRFALKSFFVSLAKPVTEFRKWRDNLEQYLVDLDNRTSKYFHCVTNTKVTTYFILTQIREVMIERTTEIDRCMERKTQAAALEVFDLLTKALEFTDGAVAGAGMSHRLPPSRLVTTVPALIDNLESGLKLLEDEIASAKSRYSPGSTDV